MYHFLVCPNKVSFINRLQIHARNCTGDYEMFYCFPQGNIYANIAELDMNKKYGRLSCH